MLTYSDPGYPNTHTVILSVAFNALVPPLATSSGLGAESPVMSLAPITNFVSNTVLVSSVQFVVRSPLTSTVKFLIISCSTGNTISASPIRFRYEDAT